MARESVFGPSARLIIETTVRNRQQRGHLYADPEAAINEATEAAEQAHSAPLPEWSAAIYGYYHAGDPPFSVPAPVTREGFVIRIVEKILMRHEEFARCA